ncbi:MAG TPA: DUF58 domain-containing protein [Stellaceae bacterium]|jgi:uncharacterized protein (DUF58 family)|nr:DUF58 domain-containing protein [Stellaceae bacterium]
MAETGAVVRQHRAEQLAAAFPPLLVAAERVANAVAQGVHGRRRVGQGDTFWQFRPYSTNDAASRIDWRASAKSARLYVRESEWEAAQSVWLWRDGSASMDYASAPGHPTKREGAEVLLLAVASLLLRGSERVTLLGSGAPPNSGRAVLMRLAHGLASSSAGLPPFALLPRDSQLVLFGDFLSPLEAVDALVSRHSARGVRGHLLQILDPAEETMPFTGRVRFEGLEGEAPILMSRAESVRDAYVAKLEGHRAGLRAIAAAAHWSFGTHRTDRPAPQALLGLYNALAVPRPF